jgi:hypothetical protein
MAKKASLGAAAYVGGFDVSGGVNALSRIGGGPSNILDLTTINQSAFERQGTSRTGEMAFTSVFDPAALAEHAALSTLPLTDVIVTYFDGPLGIGNGAMSCNSKQVNYDPVIGQDDSLIFAVDALSNGSGIEMNGWQLTAGRRVDGSATAAGAGNSYDTGASLAFGAQMYVHLFAFAGTSVTIKVQDSADNITFLDIAGTSLTTTALTTANQAVRVAIPNTTTVRRYLAVGTTGTFTNADFAVMVVKNQVAGFVT